MQYNAAITPSERELHKAKEALSLLSQLTSQAERGAAIDFDKALQTAGAVSANLQLLSQGQIPFSHEFSQGGGGGGGGGGSSSGSGSGSTTGGVVVGGVSDSVHARTAATAYNTGGVTELQKRRAQQVLSELQLIDTTLRRYQKKAQQAAGHASHVQQLLGKYGSHGDAGRNDYNELEQLHREQESLQYTRRRIQQMNSESQAVLQALQSQTGRMSGTGDKLANMMESIGVSNTTVLQIVRRNQVDAWLVYGGILAFIVLMWYIL